MHLKAVSIEGVDTGLVSGFAAKQEEATQKNNMNEIAFFTLKFLF